LINQIFGEKLIDQVITDNNQKHQFH